MKKIVLMGVAALAALGFTACDNNNNQAAPQVGNGNAKDVLYTGIIPAADAQGTIYTLRLEYDDDNNYTDGDYTLVENSLVSDTLSVAGVKAVATGYSEGDFKKLSKQVEGATVEYIQLTPEAKEVQGAASNGQLYFILNPDQSLILVNADLQTPENAELYTLTVR